MQPKSELELFLQAQSAEGEVDSAGSFTLAAEEALRKLAAFQLPYECAWAVKLVQAIVAGGSDSPIRVDLLATSIRFFFLEPGFTLEEIESEFANPEPPPNRSLRHLLSGLWAVGLRNRWGFQVAFPGQSSTLIWDGHRMHRVESHTTRDVASFVIAPLQQKSGMSWVAGMATSAGRNAEILLALARNCYPCPVPLTVDGRRLDTLQRAEHHGAACGDYPLTIGFAEADLPPLRVPPGTFEALPREVRAEDRSRGDGGGWKSVSKKRLKNLVTQSETGVAFTLCLHMKIVGTGKSKTWGDAQVASTVYWVLDGALIGEEPLLRRSYHASVGVFLSADGLETDLTGFKLRKSPMRAQRLVLAREVILRPLQVMEDGDFDEIVKDGTLFHRVLGGVLVAGGVGMCWLSPLHGVGTAVVGRLIFKSAGTAERSRVEKARSSIDDLRDEIRKAST